MARNTIYVLGAGASYEIGLPVGNKLKDDISRILQMKFEFGSFSNGNYELYQALRLHTDNNNDETNLYIKECRHISDNMPLAISIDNFIDSERGNDKLALCGKIAIVDAILAAEKQSQLYFDKFGNDRKINFSYLENTWYLPFFRTLTENCRAADLPERFSGITLIIFNYDRCIEHFLIQALISYYRLPENEAADIISNLNIIHPYGTVGSLPWQDQTSSTRIDYGGDIQSNQLIKYAQRIRTFTEGAHSEQMGRLKSNMKYSERLVFLGFAFHRLNMQLLMGDSNERYENPAPIDCFATAFEASKNDQNSISASIKHLFKSEIRINIENTTCAQLFKDNSRSLGYE
ncbi:hypothetical protein MNBD_GAMMA06-862 [hydrothermal vent metagenome]|uniref:SIR2-like domain-containing protein n=1 Tax=hydrothermal vent metagenome TaxID=652676 RepID=A0A3B0XCX0_9ZZZZ